MSAVGGSGGGAGTGTGSGGAGTGSGGSGGNTGPTRMTALRIDDEPRAGGAIRALLPDIGPTGWRQVGYALPIERGRYLVRLPDSCAAPFEDRGAALAALRSLAPHIT